MTTPPYPGPLAAAPTETSPLAESPATASYGGKEAVALASPLSSPRGRHRWLREWRDTIHRSLRTARHLIWPLGIFAAFVAASTAVYHHLEGWSWGLSVYFCIVAMTTVGYGDVVPVTDGGKIFTIIYIFLSFTIVFSCIALIFAAVGSQSDKGNNAVLAALRAGAQRREKKKEADEDPDTPVSSLYAAERRDRRETMRRTMTEKMLQQRRDDARHGYKRDFLQVSLSLCVVILSFAMLDHFSEGRPYLDSFYWAVVTVSTVGFGDMAPQEPRTRTVVAWRPIEHPGPHCAPTGRPPCVQSN
jgi:hypothetical protein